MRDDIVESARSWIGTPYKHQHSTKGQGTDCLGLIRGVWREVIGPEPEPTPAYSPTWAEVGTEEVLINAAARNLYEVRSMNKGDVLFFRMKPTSIAKHCGIYAGDQRFIHSYNRRGVIESNLGGWWTSKIAAIYRFPNGN